MSVGGEGVGRGHRDESASTPGWEAAARECEYTLELPGGVPMFFRRIPAGEFEMGSRDRTGGRSLASTWEQPPHRVKISRDFFMACFPVTQHQLAIWTRKEGVAHENHFSGSDLLPAEWVDWDQAVEFCAWLTRRGGSIPLGWTARLPSEAQWEYACRAGTCTEYASVDGEGALTQVGWFADNSGGETRPVGCLRPNDFGLFDMHGNVNEWCADAWNEDVYRSRCDGVVDPLHDPEGDDSRPDRVIRGGSWRDPALLCRSASRVWSPPSIRYHDQGFRVCLLPGSGPPARHPRSAGRQPSGGARRRRRARRRAERSVGGGHRSGRVATESRGTSSPGHDTPRGGVRRR